LGLASIVSWIKNIVESVSGIGRKRQMEALMPAISRFLGISIYMYYRGHEPPHFHAEYGEFEVKVEIECGIVSGRFP